MSATEFEPTQNALKQHEAEAERHRIHRRGRFRRVRRNTRHKSLNIFAPRRPILLDIDTAADTNLDVEEVPKGEPVPIYPEYINFNSPPKYLTGTIFDGQQPAQQGSITLSTPSERSPKVFSGKALSEGLLASSVMRGAYILRPNIK